MMQRTEQQYNDAKKLLQKIDQEQENVRYVTIAIMITAKNKEKLERRTKKVQSALAGSKMKGRTAMFKQEDALNAVSPYGICPESIQEIAKRNMPISTVAGSYPFNSSGLNDGRGYIYGKDNSGGIILIDPWLRGGDRTNSNWTILGLPGVGKSTAVKHMFLNEYSQGTKIIIIDPEREYKELCENLGGQWINCGGGRGGKINPLQVKEVPSDDEDDNEDDKLYKDEGKGIGPLALHMQTIRTFFRLYLKNLKDIDRALLEMSLEEVYKEKNIDYDTDISTIPNEQYPLMEDLYNYLVEKAKDETLSEKRRDQYDDLSLLLRSIAIGADSALWNGHTTIKAKSDFIVLDTYNLQDADESTKRTQYFNILTWAWQQLSNNRDEKVLLGIDEAYLIVDPEVPQALQFARNVSKRIRKYMGGLAVITHSVVDFLDESVKRHGQALLDNPCFKFFMGSDGKNLEELTKLMNLTEAEQEMLEKKKRGHGLLIAGSKRIHAKVELADHEAKLFGKGGGK
ncbi:MAG: ATP-binding protein [Peptostreptococcaceae bacterium]|nr:ATP-binding protein [Peptostreptococcaceae bacterium]